MYVEKLNILNIRSYQNVSLEFSPGINLIVGANNSGKSSVLRCLQKLQKGLAGISKEDVRKLCNAGAFHIKLANLKVDDKQLFQPGEGSLLLGKWQDIFFSFWNDNKKGKTEEQLQATGGLLNVELKIDEISTSLVSGGKPGNGAFHLFPGFPSMENENNFIYPFLAKRKTTHYNSQQGLQSAYGISDQFHNLPARIQNLVNDTHPFSKDYKKYCEDILGFTPGKVPGPQNNEDKLGIFVRMELVYLESMGDGVANILGLLAILLTENNKLFLIEELENDIHPEALKKLLEIILEKSKTNQFVISTHSNIILKYLASIPETKIFYTDWKFIEVDNPNKFKIPTSTIEPVENTPEERLRILTKLGYDLFDFDLYSSYIIFEESSAEQVVKEFLMPVFAPNLQSKVKTIAAGGASNIPARFDDFLRLFVFIHNTPIYHQKAWVIADGDDEGKKNVAKLIEKFKTWPKGHFITLSKKNFEEYYPPAFKEEYEKIVSEAKDKKEKLKRKGELTRKLLNWIKVNPIEAKAQFEKNATEIIDLLKQLEIAVG